MLTYILFALGFIALIKGADLLVEGSASIAKKLNVSNLVIGLTVMAFGTSTPELVINIVAALKGTNDIAIGNILGSNIANILLILGICTLIRPLVVQKNTVWKEMLLALLAAVIVGLAANDSLIDGMNFSGLSRIDGLIFMAFFIIFLYYTFGIAKNMPEDERTHVKKMSTAISIIAILAGMGGLVLGGNWVVAGAIKIAEAFGMSQKLIGLTIVAVGTSLPELAASAVATYKKHNDIAIGNIVGSNIYNIFWVLGIGAIIRPIEFRPEANPDILMTILASFLLFVAMLVGKKYILERWQGIFFIIIYAAYVIFATMQGKL